MSNWYISSDQPLLFSYGSGTVTNVTTPMCIMNVPPKQNISAYCLSRTIEEKATSGKITQTEVALSAPWKGPVSSTESMSLSFKCSTEDPTAKKNAPPPPKGGKANQFISLTSKASTTSVPDFCKDGNTVEAKQPLKLDQAALNDLSVSTVKSKPPAKSKPK